MKHEHLMTEADHADLERAAALVGDGKRLRKQVFARLRARAYREGTKKDRENHFGNP